MSHRTGTERVKSPIIFIGMHRSGTTMLTRMLDELGVFVGMDKDYNWESEYFRKQNDWAIETSGGAWDHPTPILDLLADDSLVDAAAKYLEIRLTALASRAFWGGGPFYLSSRNRIIRGPWGWKDPRNSFTLPIWLRLFPDAGVVHIHRHGIDVAASLRHRERKSRASRFETFEKNKRLYRVLPKRGGFSGSYRCADLDRAFRLWGEYMDQIAALDRVMPGRILHVCYEDLLDDPARHLALVVERLSIPCSAGEVKTVAASANADRCFAFQRDPELVDAAKRWDADLSRWGYGPEGRAPSRHASSTRALIAD